MTVSEDTRAMMSDAAKELHDSLMGGSTLLSTNHTTRIELGDDDENPVSWTVGRNTKNLSEETSAKRLNAYKPNILAKLQSLTREEADEQIAAGKQAATKKLEAMKVTTTTTKNESKPKASEAKAEKVEYPEIPSVEAFTDELVYIKTGKYNLGDSPYMVHVKRDRDGFESFEARLNGEAIGSKGRAHKVLRTLFPYHVSKRRRGYDIDATGPAITAKPNGESTEKAATRKPKKEIVVPDGFQLMAGGEIRQSDIILNAGGKDAPEGENVREVVLRADALKPHPEGKDYNALHLAPVGKKNAARVKFVSTRKQFVVRKGSARKPLVKYEKGNGNGRLNGNGKPKAEKKNTKNTEKVAA